VPNAIGGRGAYDTPTYFDAGTPNARWIYYAGQGDSLRAFQLADDGTLSTSSTSQSSNVFNASHGATPSLSADGTTNAIVWAINPDNPAVLYAYDATNLANELYDSSQAGTRDQLDAGVKFSVPTIADGEVFVGTAGTLSVFGLLPGGRAAAGKNGRGISDPGIVQLLGPLPSQQAAGISGSGNSFGAGQAIPAASQSVQEIAVAPMSPAGSSWGPQKDTLDRYAKDSFFAAPDSATQRPESARDLGLLALDLVGPSPVLA
jgi:hypothetical protein